MIVYTILVEIYIISDSFDFNTIYSGSSQIQSYKKITYSSIITCSGNIIVINIGWALSYEVLVENSLDVFVNCLSFNLYYITLSKSSVFIGKANNTE